MDSRTVGILGGGQLGRMLLEAANRLNVKTIVLDAENSPAMQISNSTEHIVGSYSNPNDIRALAAKCDVLTIEIEHVDVEVLKELQKERPSLRISPDPETIRLVQDKFLQKEHLREHNVAVIKSIDVSDATVDGLTNIAHELGFPFVLKSKRMAYDGRGNFVVRSQGDIATSLASLGGMSLYAEKWAPFTKELAVMVVKTIDGGIFSYPVVETVHRDNICHLCYVPARVPDSVHFKATSLAEHAVKSLPGAGIFGVELFHLANGELLVNEIAPRPHNSGHYTIDACVTSQFEAHLRAILGLPIKPQTLSLNTTTTNCIMLNVLGDAKTRNAELQIFKRALDTPGASVYLYGKESRPGRKIGHINIVSSSMQQCERALDYINGRISSLGDNLAEAREEHPPEVGIIMGSDSDLPVMSTACKILEKFNVPYEVTIVSAHRTPHRMSKYATEASNRGIKVIIAGAGGAAHLPGMVAAMTPLPVIGVPIKGSTLDGVDSLHSIVQMPRGVPVATVAINNSTNAALLAVRILGTFAPEYHLKMQKFLLDQEEEVLEKAEKLESVGYGEYLSSMGK